MITAALAWVALSPVVALLIGQAIRLADRHGPPAQRDMDLAA